MKEAQELSISPSPDYHAAPLDTNIFEWHFTLRGPPSSPFATGLYHGRIVLPPTYPLRPPSFRFLTPSGRFEVNREICLSISGFHEESWQPAWGLRTAIVALRSFMETDAEGQLGGVEASGAVRERLAGESRGWKCKACGGRSNEEIIRETEDLCDQAGGGKVEEMVPEELSLGYKDQMEGKKDKGKGRETDPPSQDEPAQAKDDANGVAKAPVTVATSNESIPPASHGPSTSSISQRRTATSTSSTQSTTGSAVSNESSSSAIWIDKAIMGVAFALAFMLLRKWMADT